MDTSVDPVHRFLHLLVRRLDEGQSDPSRPDELERVSSKLEDDNKLILRDVLETAAKPAANRDATNQKIGDYYAACMDEKAIDAAGLKPLQRRPR